ncbi:hypothetical protein BrevBR_08200 [Brevundimonas sp. BR2-1]|uniref:hypothetical protein n=1 Tax=Brevundimonas sp. BR2-1 TaxID=3031123 RepID=UPI0030B4BC33
MGKSLGITAFVLLLISLPIPIFGNYISLLAVLILSLAAFQGEKNWVVIVDLLAWVKMFLLSPTWHVMMFGSGYMRGVNREVEGLGTVDSASRSVMQGATNDMAALNNMILLITVVILAAPVGIMVWRSRVPTITEPAADA